MNKTMDGGFHLMTVRTMLNYPRIVDQIVVKDIETLSNISDYC
jgi:hypothetical protein